MANLKEHFPNEADRVLSATFIERLLTASPSEAGVPRHGVRIAYGTVVGSLDLEDVEIAHETHLIGIRFAGDVNLSRSTFLKGLSVAESSFKKVNCNRMKVNGDFVADGAQFTDPEQTADFHSLRVGGDAVLSKAVFAGPVSFLNADIAGNLEAGGIQFTNAARAPNFEFMKVGGWALFPEALFAGGVDFRVASIGASGANFVVDGARFTNAELEATFNSMKVGGVARFHGTSFAGPADFIAADVGAFEAQGVRFSNAKQYAWFDRMRVAGKAWFNNAVFMGRVSFRHAHFLVVELPGVSWPPGRDDRGESLIELDGMTYQDIEGLDAGTSWEELLALANNARYNTGVYTNLEDFFLRQGQPERANAVFIAQKRRERGRLGTGAWASNFLLDVLVGYGRRPELAFVYSAIFVAIGYFVFRRREGMELQKAGDPPRHYDPLWYSLDLFVPFIDLQAANVWMPNQDRRFARHYARAHRILGWLLIPIGLAAVTGIIK